MTTASIDIEKLLGTWRLVEWSANVDDILSYPFTAQATGRLTYLPCGLMTAFLQSPGWASSTVDFVPQRHRFIAYSGRYRIDGSIVTHAVDMASDPRWIGNDLIRNAVLAGGMLTIDTKPTAGFGVGRFHHRLRWEPVI